MEHGTNLVNVLLLDRDDIPAFWGHIKGYLSDALDKSQWSERYPLPSLYADLLTGDSQCWIVSKNQLIIGVAVTQEIQYPLGKSLFVYLLGGKSMDEWACRLHKEFDIHAQGNNIKWIDACARHGLGKKYLVRIGYHAVSNHYCYKVKDNG